MAVFFNVSKTDHYKKGEKVGVPEHTTITKMQFIPSKVIPQGAARVMIQINSTHRPFNGLAFIELTKDECYRAAGALIQIANGLTNRLIGEPRERSSFETTTNTLKDLNKVLSVDGF